MDVAELRKLAVRTRFMREAGIALVLASAVLGLFLFVPLSGKPGAEAVGNTASSTPPAPAPDAFADVPIEAQAAIVYDLATGKTLYEKNATAQLPLASLTKLLTVYAALSAMPSASVITIPDDVMGLSAPHAFSPGESFTLSDLARITLTASLNDGAAAIAEATALRESRSTADMMANAATGLGLAQTYAINGNGLDENTAISGGYGSAHDIAVLAGALVAKAPDIAAATTENTASAVSEAGQAFTVKNTDPMTENFPRLLLSKTGFTDLAGGNLALVFDAGIEHPVAIVVLGSTEDARFTDGQALVAATLAHFAGVPSL